MSVQTRILSKRVVFTVIGMITSVIAIIILLRWFDESLPNVSSMIVLAPGLPVAVLFLGLLRIARSEAKQRAWRREWKRILDMNEKFQFPLFPPRTKQGQEALYKSIPYNPKLYLRMLLPKEDIFSFRCGEEPTERCFGEICGKVLAAWAELKLPDVTIYRFCTHDGFDSVWIKAQVFKSAKMEAYALAGMRFSRLGGMGQIAFSARSSLKFTKAQKPIDGWWHQSDYVHATRFYFQLSERFARMFPLVAFLYVPGMIAPRWEFATFGAHPTEQLQLTGLLGELEDELLIDAARLGGAPMLSLNAVDAAKLTEVVNVLKLEMIKAIQ